MISISMIIPMFNYIKTNVINHNPSDSNFMQTMKSHMRTKLENRYSEKQEKLLTTITFFDPRYKSRVQGLYCEGHLKNTITKFVRENEADYIQATQGQELENIVNSNFATPPGSSAGNRPRQANDLSAEEQMFKSLWTDDDQDGEVVNNTTLQQQIDTEVS